MQARGGPGLSIRDDEAEVGATDQRRCRFAQEARIRGALVVRESCRTGREVHVQREADTQGI